jgi:hypothetical protein
MGLCFSTNFLILLHFLCIRIVKILLELLIEYLDFHYHCIGGIHDPDSSFEVVKSYQENHFGAVAATREEVNSLRLYRTLDALNLLLIDKKTYSKFIKNVVEEASKNFTCDRTMSKNENRENFDKLVSENKKLFKSI